MLVGFFKFEKVLGFALVGFLNFRNVLGYVYSVLAFYSTSTRLRFTRFSFFPIKWSVGHLSVFALF